MGLVLPEVAVPLIDQTEAIVRLKRHLPALREIVVGGWNDYLTGYSEAQRVVHTSTTRANIVHDHQIDRASRYCQSADGARLADLSRMKVVVLEDAGAVFAIRIKKFNEDMCSVNQPTRQVLDFRAQERLPGLPETYNLEAGYLLRRYDGGIEGAYLVCPNGPQPYWSTALDDGAANQTLFDFRQPKSPDDGNDGAAEVIVRPKQGGIIVPLRRDGDEG